MIPLLHNPHLRQLIADEIVKTINEDRWDRFIATSETPQRKYRVKMRELFANQLEDVLVALNRKSVKGIYNAEQIDWNDYRIQYNEFSQLELPGILTAWANLELEALEVGISFDVVEPRVISAITARSNLFSDSVVNSTRQALHQLIADSINAGDGIPQLEKKIRLLYANMSKYRATRIARSEVIWAQNEGAELSYMQSNVVSAKEWWTARDERTCPFCASMHGKPIDLGTNYFNKGDILELPKPDKAFDVEVTTAHGKWLYGVYTKLAKADTIRLKLDYEDIRHPPLHPHCRCTLIPILVDLSEVLRSF